VPAVEVINMRADAELKEQLRVAAELTHVSLSKFVLDAAAARADQVFADQRATELPEEFFDEFFEAINEPAPAALAALTEHARPYRRR
jgi:uncharacterized protein (DUF1778 family)